MGKRLFFFLCLMLAAAFLMGCDRGGTVHINLPDGNVSARTPVPPRGPSKTPAIFSVPTATPTPELTPALQTVQDEVIALKLGEPQTIGETTYTVTEEFDEYNWATTRLLAEEDNGWASAVSYEGYFMSVFYFQTGLGPCILISVDVGGADAPATYAVDALSLAEGDGISGYVKSIDGSLVDIGDRIDMLGTYASSRSYTVGAYFALVPAGDGLYHIIGNDHFLITTRELPAQLFANDQFQDGTLRAGTELCITATDGSTAAYFATKDGREGKLTVSRREEPWSILINGIPEEAWFEELPYSG